MDGFTRQETLALTQITSSRLAYLDRTSVVVPKKYGNSKKPTVIYTWEQLLEIRTIANLRKQISLQMVRKLVSFLDEHGLDITLHDKHLVATPNEVFLVMPDWSDMPQVMKVADRDGEGLGQLVLLVLPPLKTVIQEIWNAAANSTLVDFESFKQRAKSAPAQAG
ncbi:MerR family transcriptional regulator [Oscillatoria sp. CS-180]|uniref:MerR family transcriptional regulator n=1 Tax=Oscillatoria sp. CS-180 TaxID=3021720 RepID=UPI00232C8034|nr:MerR family transcriptional regulator [Oscillatoria sp. CS-180]MDB9526112.1 MerR family transcriptional regulator [Oscillatoria sp. CS-180]